MSSFPNKEEIEKSADGGGAIVARVISSLDERLRTALEFFSLPHWVDDAVLRRTALEQHPGMAELAQLKDLGLIELWNEGVLAVRSPIRSAVLERVTSEHPDTYLELSGVFARAFRAVAKTGGDVFHHIESVFHSLVSERGSAEAQLLADGVTWKSEPFFAFGALARIISVAEERQKQGLLSEQGKTILTLLQLFNPQSALTALKEATVLEGLEKRSPPSPLFTAELLLRVGLNQIVLGRPAHAREVLTDALSQFRELQVRRGEGDALRAIGRAALREDNLQMAKDYFGQARRIFDELGLRLSAAYCEKSLGETAFYLGDFASANAQFQSVLKVFEGSNAGLAEANTRVVYSQLLAMMAHYSAAHRHLGRAQQIYQAIDNKLGIGNCLKNAGVALFEAGEYSEARKQLAEAQKFYAEWGSITGRANCMLWTAACVTRETPSLEALALLDQADRLFAQSGERFGWALAKRERGLALMALQQPANAIGWLTEAERAFHEAGNSVEELAATVAKETAAAAAGLLATESRAEVIATGRRAYKYFLEIGHRRYSQEAANLVKVMAEDQNMNGPI